MATTRTSAAKKPATGKPAAKKPAGNKPAVKKPAARKAEPKKAAPKKAEPKKAEPKKAAPKKAAPKKAAPKKAAPKKAAPKKTVVQKPAAKKAVAKKPAQKTGPQVLRAVEMFPAPPREIYSCYVEAHRHELYTGGKCISEARVGGRFVAYDDYIRGKYLELEPGHRIVQEWSTTDWPPGAPPSRLELILEPKGTGTELTMIHSGVPADQAKSLEQGWQDFYWVPLRMYLEQKNK